MNGKLGSSAGIEEEVARIAIGRIREELDDYLRTDMIDNQFKKRPKKVGLSSLGIAAFVLRLICSNGMIRKTEIGASYRHVSYKILSEFPKVFENVSYELGKQKSQFLLSMESPVNDPVKTLESFNRQFQLKEPEHFAVEWAWPQEMGDTMFNIVNTYTRASQFPGLSAESSYQLQRVGGNILGMLN